MNIKQLRAIVESAMQDKAELGDLAFKLLPQLLDEVERWRELGLNAYVGWATELDSISRMFELKTALEQEEDLDVEEEMRKHRLTERLKRDEWMIHYGFLTVRGEE